MKTIMYRVYPETTYGIAKQYCIENMTLGEIRWEDFEGFTFIDNLALETMYSPDSQIGYPRWFNMFAYNDSSHTLLFLGYYGSIAAEADEKELALTDFPAFLKVIYSDCFDN